MNRSALASYQLALNRPSPTPSQESFGYDRTGGVPVVLFIGFFDLFFGALGGISTSTRAGEGGAQGAARSVD